MLVACWSAKGGSGATVVAAGLAVLLARSGSEGALAVDLGGDLPAVLGLPEPGGPGVTGWMAAGPDLGPDELHALEQAAGHGLAVIGRGDGPVPAAAADGERLAACLAGPRPVVVDCGPPGEPAGLAVAAAASLSLLVLRPCFLALRRAVAAPLRPSGVILVAEAGRALGRQDVEQALGVPVRAEVAWDPAVARCVDAGLMAGRVPRTLERALRRAS